MNELELLRKENAGLRAAFCRQSVSIGQLIEICEEMNRDNARLKSHLTGKPVPALDWMAAHGIASAQVGEEPSPASEVKAQA